MTMLKLLEVTSAPTITAGAYSAGDVVGGLLTFTLQSGSGVFLLKSVRIVDDDNEKAASHLYLFNSEPTTIADNGAFAPTVADLKKMVANIAIAAADFSTLNSNAVALIEDLTAMFKSDTGKVYGYLVCDATPTYTAVTDLSIKLAALTE